MEGACVIREAAMLLKVPESVAHAATAYYNRCTGYSSGGVVGRRGDSAREVQDMFIAACLFLATKTLDEPRRIRDVINATYRVRNSTLLTNAREYWRLKEELIHQEQLLLRILGFDTHVEHAQPLLLYYLRVLRASGPLCGLSAAILNDSSSCTLCASWAPQLIASAAIALASTLLKVQLPQGWWRAFDTQEDQLAVCCHALLDLYQHDCGLTTHVAAPGTAEPDSKHTGE